MSSVRSPDRCAKAPSVMVVWLQPKIESFVRPDKCENVASLMLQLPQCERSSKLSLDSEATGAGADWPRSTGLRFALSAPVSSVHDSKRMDSRLVYELIDTLSTVSASKRPASPPSACWARRCERAAKACSWCCCRVNFNPRLPRKFFIATEISTLFRTSCQGMQSTSLCITRLTWRRFRAS